MIRIGAARPGARSCARYTGCQNIRRYRPARVAGPVCTKSVQSPSDVAPSSPAAAIGCSSRSSRGEPRRLRRAGGRKRTAGPRQSQSDSRPRAQDSGHVQYRQIRLDYRRDRGLRYHWRGAPAATNHERATPPGGIAMTETLAPDLLGADLRDVLADLERRGDLRHVDEANPHLELGAITEMMALRDGPAL